MCNFRYAISKDFPHQSIILAIMPHDSILGIVLWDNLSTATQSLSGRHLSFQVHGFIYILKYVDPIMLPFLKRFHFEDEHLVCPSLWSTACVTLNSENE